MKIVITGVAGFIGSTLAEELLLEGHTVIGIDCFTDYYERSIKESNLKGLRSKKNFTFIEGDLLSVDLIKLLKDVKVVFHEAGQPGVRKSWGVNFNAYIQNNILATQVLLEAATKCSLKHLIYASSSSVYGNAEMYPTREDVLPRPVSPYGVTKLACEHLCNAYQANYNLPIVILRYFTVFGPRQRPDMAFHKFIRAALDNQPITVFGNGLQTRDFTYVKDIVKANMLIIDKGIEQGLFNIGGGSRTTINDIIKIIGDNLGKKLEIQYKDVEKGDVKHTAADTSKARKELGFQPRHNLKEGLAQEILWIKNEFYEKVYNKTI